MKILEYAEFIPPRDKAKYQQIRQAIERNDFQAVDVKKLVNLTHGKFYRVKLDYADRLLFSIVQFEGQAYALMLEVIHQHAYHKSRFLRGASVDEAQIVPADVAEAQAEAAPVRFLHPERLRVHWLDKAISFDDAQQAVYLHAAPMIIVGSAGSGKTALTLEKLKQMPGDVLYVTHSAYLAQSARELYYADGFERVGQEASFLSFREFVETIKVPAGREASWRDFSAWFGRMRQQFKQVDAHQAYEEIRGVLAADASGALTREQYLGLGPRQCIFAADQRASLYELFDKYCLWLRDAGLYDLNLIAHDWMQHAAARYDFIVVDEVQDLTVVQLALVLHALKNPAQFLLCGDSNQIVHPNFFSWSKIKSLFWRDPALAERQQLQILRNNFRNSAQVTGVANALLKIKHKRFGSIDRESNFLVTPVNQDTGTVTLLADDANTRRQMNEQTRRSTQFAVLVLRDEDKAEARRHFDTPLLFSIHEAKGLEYDNIVLYRFVSDQRTQFSDIAAGVTPADLAVDDLHYSRAKDKADKSLEIYKFYVNALYVALTRAIHNVYLIESDTGHALLGLLNLAPGGMVSRSDTQASSVQDWQKEARRLALQGKQEQADAIERLILKTCAPPWNIFDEARLRDTLARVFLEQAPGSKSKSQLYDYATCYDEPLLAEMLADELGFEQAKSYARLASTQGRRAYLPYFARNVKDILGQCDKYGIEHRTAMNQTPLMAAAAAGNIPLLEALLARGADRTAVDHLGRNALHWAIATALRDRAYAAASFSAVFRLVAPACVDVMAGQRLIRIDRHQSEYLFFQVMWVLFRQCFGTLEMTDRGGIDGAMLQDAFERLPVEVVVPERTRRAYISGVLARNEVDRDYAYNRRLFKRLMTGVYQFSPALSVRRHGASGDEWVPVFAALNLALVKETCDPYYAGYIDQLLVEGQLAAAPEPMSMTYLREKRCAQSNPALSQPAAGRKAPKK